LRTSRKALSYFFSSPSVKPTCVYRMTPPASKRNAGQPYA
jgi:hypothetical protein